MSDKPFYQLACDVEREQAGREVFVYFNLTKKCWSVKDVKSGLVAFHCEHLYLRDAMFRVSEPGRFRVNKEGRKNVHAGVQGFIASCDGYNRLDNQYPFAVSYDPYKFRTFVRRHDEAPMHSAQFVCMISSSKEKVRAKVLTSIKEHLQCNSSS
jgi:hypothetical protein